MEVEAHSTTLPGVLVITTDFFRDERGFFIESYHKARYAKLGIEADFVQDNHSRSCAGVLRGLHYQDATAPMGKLVRCTRGRIFDVAVDLRSGSATYGKWAAEELTEYNMRQLWVPPGFAHGFATLSESAEVQYKCSGYYTPSSEGTIRWDDEDLAIAWPLAEPVLSIRDSAGRSFRDYRANPSFTLVGTES